jgi:hypothetical protein
MGAQTGSGTDSNKLSKITFDSVIRWRSFIGFEDYSRNKDSNIFNGIFQILMVKVATCLKNDGRPELEYLRLKISESAAFPSALEKNNLSILARNYESVLVKDGFNVQAIEIYRLTEFFSPLIGGCQHDDVVTWIKFYDDEGHLKYIKFKEEWGQ